MIVACSQLMEGTFETMQQMSMHHRTHIEIKEKREEVRRKLAEETKVENKVLLQKQIDLITDWDEKCKFITPESVEKIGEITLRAHETICEFRSTLAKRSLI
jgi:hypothetical protein